MFQFATGYAVSKRWKETLELDTSYFKKKSVHNGFELERLFGIQARVESDLFAKRGYLLWYALLSRLGIDRVHDWKTVVELQSSFIPLVFQKRFDNYDGFWQSEEYFKEYRKDILDRFTFMPFDERSSNSDQDKNLTLSKEIVSCESVSVHVRRGDYLKSPNYVALGETNYYQRAVKMLKKKKTNAKFYVFSDDIQWCIENLDISDAIYVDWNQGGQSFRDMQLMSLCKNNIIANSSFSWWGAWLNTNPSKIVVAPDAFNINRTVNETRLIPSNWIQLGVRI